MQEALKQMEYIPGQCNIGPDEVRRRLRIGYIGLGMMALFVIFAEFYKIPQAWKLVLFAPTVYALSGFLQARQRFCLLFGFLGIFSIAGKRSRVGDKLQIHKDRTKALSLITQMFLGSLVVTLLYYFLTSS